MRILLLNQYYYPDVAATAQLATDLAEHLVQRGHEVTVVTSTRAYAGSDPEAHRPRRQHHRGVRIVRVPSTAFGRGTNLGRSVDYATFLSGALAQLFAGARPDVVVALSTPPLVAALGLLAQRLRGARLVYWVMDVYPDVAVKLGVLRADGVSTHALRRISNAVLAKADAVVALDEAMRERLVAAGGPRSRIEVIDNWSDGAAIRPTPSESNHLRRALGIERTFTVSYSGNMGMGHDFPTLLGAMKLLRDEPVHWLFIGDGPRRAPLESAVRRNDLRRVSFLPYRQRSELGTSLTAADASLVSVAAGLAGMMVPSKLYGILAAGMPVLYVGPAEGRVADVIAKDGVGIAIENGDSVALAGAIRRLRDEPPLREQMGRRARRLFETRFDRPVALERHHQLLCRVGGVPC